MQNIFFINIIIKWKYNENIFYMKEQEKTLKFLAKRFLFFKYYQNYKKNYLSKIIFMCLNHTYL